MKLFDKFYKIETGFLGAVMLGATVLLFINVMLRYFFHSAIFWVEEALRYMIAWIIFIGISNCVKEHSHISVDILPNYGGPKVKRVISFVVDIVGAGFGIVFTYYSIRFLIMSKATGQAAATLGAIPMYLIYLCMPISCVLYALCSIVNIIENICGKGEELNQESDEGGES